MSTHHLATLASACKGQPAAGMTSTNHSIESGRCLFHQASEWRAKRQPVRPIVAIALSDPKPAPKPQKSYNNGRTLAVHTPALCFDPSRIPLPHWSTMHAVGRFAMVLVCMGLLACMANAREAYSGPVVAKNQTFGVEGTPRFGHSHE